MSITRSFVNQTSFSGTSASITSSAFDSTGFTHLLVVGRGRNAPTSNISCSDTNGTTFTSLTALISGNVCGRVFYGPIGTPGAGHTVTVTFDVGQSFPRVVVYGVTASGAIDIDALVTGTGAGGTPINLGTLNTSAETVSFYLMANDNADTATPGTGWTEDTESGIYGESRTDATATSFSATATPATGWTEWVGWGVAVKEAVVVSQPLRVTVSPLRW